MNSGIGEGRTWHDHREWSDQLYASYARPQARAAWRPLSVVGPAPSRPRALDFAEAFEHRFIHQGDTRRTIGETVEAGWELLDALPREDLARLSDRAIESRRQSRAGDPDSTDVDPARQTVPAGAAAT
jgi:V/A-type H+-transporting ATPase subunit B